ncbi:MAG TPA: SLATT domain-containing protein [Pyrinomonadaceae bacterium]
MSENIPPQADENDDLYTAMKKLSRNAQVVRSGHFIAAQRKNRNAKIIGALVIVLNVLIGSGLIETATNDQTAVKIIIKALAFLAAALAGIQAFFNFQKEVECHTSAGDVYSSIYRRIGLIIAEYHDTPANRETLITDFKALSAEYEKANDDSKGCIPTDRDYAKARAEIEKRSIERT